MTLERAVDNYIKTVELCSVPTCAVGRAYVYGDGAVKDLWYKHHEELKNLRKAAKELIAAVLNSPPDEIKAQAVILDKINYLDD